MKIIKTLSPPVLEHVGNGLKPVYTLFGSMFFKRDQTPFKQESVRSCQTPFPNGPHPVDILTEIILCVHTLTWKQMMILLYCSLFFDWYGCHLFG